MTRLLAFVAIMAALMLLCAMLPAHAATDPVRTIGIVGRSSEHVSAAALGRVVVLTWAASSTSGTDIYAVVSRDAGDTFSTPVRVNSTAGEANVGGEQPPRVSLGAVTSGVPRIVVVWTAKGATGTRLLSARSTDGGKSFTPTSVMAGSDAPGSRGWESIATDRAGRTFALWLDHRKLAGTPSTMAHDHAAGTSTAPALSAPSAATKGATKADPVERAGQSQLFFGSVDGAVAARPLTGGVCYCCKTALATGADGRIYAAWRHVYAGNERDIAFSMSRDNGRTFSAPVRISRDSWQIDGCPENGPALAVDLRGTAHVVWPTLVRDRGRETLALFYATSTDGASFAARLRLPATGAAYHPQIAVEADGAVVVAWDEVTSDGRRVVAARGTRDAAGRIAFTRMSQIDTRAGVYPALAATPAGTMLTWVRRVEGGSTIALTRLPR
jgi:hypothetical protein